MSDNDVQARPARELTNEQLEQQGTQVQATRNWVFLHGSAEQFAHPTTCTLELERDYRGRHRKRTWQGSGGPTGVVATAKAWCGRVQGVIQQLEAVADLIVAPAVPAINDDPQTAFLKRIVDAPGSRLNKLEAHQVAREVGLPWPAVSTVDHNIDPPLLATELRDRVISDAGRARIAGIPA
jgi:hypothetical protein